MNENRETANAERYPAIPHVAGDIASGSGDGSTPSGEMPGLNIHRVTYLI
jgi:hypothetical protein